MAIRNITVIQQVFGLGITERIRDVVSMRDLPVEYERDDLAEDLDFLARLPQEATARDLGLSVRGWRNLLKGISHPRNETAERIRQLTTDYRGQGRCG
jgi:hypothetical protein